MEGGKRPLKSVHFAERKSHSSMHLVDSMSSLSREEPLPQPSMSAGPFESETRFRTFSTGSSGLKRNRSIRRRDVNMDILLSADTAGRMNGVGRFRLEPGAEQDDEEYGASNYPPIILENPQTEIRWYLRYFLGNEHQNYAGVEPHTKSPFFFSLLMEQEPDGTSRARAILWQKSGPRKLLFPISSPHPMPGKNGLAKSILIKFPGMNDYNRSLKEISEPKIQKDLIILEDQEGSINFKFGVIYRQYGQLSDDQMLSNEEGDDDFERFLALLGQRIELNGFGNFRGGLDTSSNSTGSESVYAAWAGHEIMFHVSTLLPYSHNNPQQVERKRHIGNDIVNIIFESDGDPRHPSFRPAMMKSHFTHIFALVTYESVGGVWRLWVFSEETVPAYGPVLPAHAQFSDPDKFRAFLMTKLINGEKAAFNAQAFTEKRQRTADSLIKDMFMEYMKDSGSNRGFQRVTDNVTKHWRGSQKNKEASPMDGHSDDFVKIGGLVKLEKMLSGEVPDYSEANTALCRQQPWEPRLVSKELPATEVFSSDSWGQRSVVLATSTSGVIFFSEGKSTCIIEPSAKVFQLKVLENFGLLILRCERGKEGYLGAFSLAEIRSSLASNSILTREDCYNAIIPETKGAHLFGVSDSNRLRLSLAVCIGKRVVLLRWALGPLGTLPSRHDLSHNFTRLNEVTFSEEALLISVFEIGPQSTVRACIGSKTAIELVNFSTSIVTTVYRHDSNKGEIKSLLANCDESDGLEIVLTYGSTTLVFDPNHGDERLEIFWTSDPSVVAFVFPFLLAFSQDTLEVRLGINGSLLATIYMPRVQLLAAKNDIIFSTRPHEAKTDKKGSDATMACLYKIRSHDMAGEDGGGIRKISSSKTPQMTRNASSNTKLKDKQGFAVIGGMGAPKKLPWVKNLESSSIRCGSTGSDSGFGAQERSSISSMDNFSVPASPLCLGDPFAE